ncbi:MAG: hypothetical protein WEB63_03005 [Cucumibacter sp.]
MSLPFVTDATSAVQFIMAATGVLMGLSHIVQPKMWVGFFGRLHEQGESGVVTRVMIELWPAILIVAFHQVWSGPGIVLTLYGWALSLKIVIGLLAPQIAVRGLALSQGGQWRFVGAGVVLLVIAFCAAWALWAGMQV